MNALSLNSYYRSSPTTIESLQQAYITKTTNTKFGLLRSENLSRDMEDLYSTETRGIINLIPKLKKLIDEVNHIGVIKLIKGVIEENVNQKLRKNGYHSLCHTAFQEKFNWCYKYQMMSVYVYKMLMDFFKKDYGSRTLRRDELERKDKHLGIIVIDEKKDGGRKGGEIERERRDSARSEQEFGILENKTDKFDIEEAIKTLISYLEDEKYSSKERLRNEPLIYELKEFVKEF